jgi:hypothetical protein
MSTLMSPEGRKYLVLSRDRRRLLVLDETDNFRFVFKLGDERIAGGWKVDDDLPKPEARTGRKDHNRKKATA